MRICKKYGKPNFRVYLRIDTPGYIFETAVADCKAADADELVWQRRYPILKLYIRIRITALI
jgi:hypothetical protein